jgi:hypothetical protein
MHILTALATSATIALALATTPVQSAVVYSLGPSNVLHNFELTTSDFITTDTTFQPTDLDSCSTSLGECTSVTFFIDAFSAGLSSDDLNDQAVAIGSARGTYYFYFSKPSFTTPGVHQELLTVRSLTVALRGTVPEAPSIFLAALALFALAGFVRRGPT